MFLSVFLNASKILKMLLSTNTYVLGPIKVLKSIPNELTKESEQVVGSAKCTLNSRTVSIPPVCNDNVTFVSMLFLIVIVTYKLK